MLLMYGTSMKFQRDGDHVEYCLQSETRKGRTKNKSFLISARIPRTNETNVEDEEDLPHLH